MQDVYIAALGKAGAHDIDKRAAFVAVQSLVGDLYPCLLYTSTGIDLIKTIAIFSIVMIHVSAQYLVVYGAVGTWQFDASVV